jgi:hypothetical protein
MTRRKFATALAAMATPASVFLGQAAARAATPIPVVLYKNPSCTCCEGYAQYLEQNGFAVDVRPTNSLAEISRKAGIPEELEGCHTSFIGAYVVDGHVPVKSIGKLLDERPDITGITLPGMPSGSPGMFGEKTAPLTVLAISRDGTPTRVFDVD